MKYLITVCLVSALLVGNAYADNTQTTIQQGNVEGHQTTVVKGPGYAEGGDATAQGGQGGDAAAGAYSGIYWDYSPTSTFKYPDYRAAIINPGYPQPPWWMPSKDQIALWNAATADLRFYEGTWTRKQVEGSLKKSGKWFTEWGVGFNSFRTLKSYDNKPTSKIDLRLIQNAPYELIQKDYTFLGDIPVKGSKDLGQTLTLMWGLKQAMDSGAEMAIMNPGMNVVYNGGNFSPGLGFGTAGVHGSFSFVSGLGSTDAKAQAEPVIKLAVYLKNGTGEELKSPKEVKEKERKEEKENGEEREIRGVPVIPEILNRVGFRIEPNLY